MAVWRSPGDVPVDLGQTVVTIGVFDGVHRGHQVVLARAAKSAGEAELPLAVVTFDPNPLAVVRPDAAPPALLPVARRVELLLANGADHVLVLPFDSERASQSAEEFVDDVLVRLLAARVIVVGSDFRFGHRARGDVALLERVSAERGFVVDAIDVVGGDRVARWSSTYIRQRIADGDVAAAAEALGRPFEVEGVVVEGANRGRALGFPTANVPVRDGELTPADGVYAGWLSRLDEPSGELPGVPGNEWGHRGQRGSRMPAAISVGTNPTFGGEQRSVEPYVLDRDDLELYDVAVAVEFVGRLREQQRFDSADQLVAQMHEDVAATREMLGIG